MSSYAEDSVAQYARVRRIKELLDGLEGVYGELEKDYKLVASENAELRELVSVLMLYEFHSLTVCEHCPIECNPPRPCGLPEWIRGRARALGIEAE